MSSTDLNRSIPCKVPFDSLNNNNNLVIKQMNVYRSETVLLCVAMNSYIVYKKRAYPSNSPPVLFGSSCVWFCLYQRFSSPSLCCSSTWWVAHVEWWLSDRRTFKLRPEVLCMTTGCPAVKTLRCCMYACVSILHVNERQAGSLSQTCSVQWTGNHGSTSYVVCMFSSSRWARNSIFGRVHALMYNDV